MSDKKWFRRGGRWFSKTTENPRLTPHTGAPDFQEGDQITYEEGHCGIFNNGRILITETPKIQGNRFSGLVLRGQ